MLTQRYTVTEIIMLSTAVPFCFICFNDYALFDMVVNIIYVFLFFVVRYNCTEFYVP